MIRRASISRRHNQQLRGKDVVRKTDEEPSKQISNDQPKTKTGGREENDTYSIPY